jgi:hypothetical protein
MLELKTQTMLLFSAAIFSYNASVIFAQALVVCPHTLSLLCPRVHPIHTI